MKISKRSQYGLRAMIYLAKADKEFSSLREISKNEGISFSYLEKILGSLEKAGLIVSKRGFGGGYSLAKEAKRISVGEIMRALEGELVLVECIGGIFCPRRSSCRGVNAWSRLQSSIEKTINNIMLSELYG